MKGQSAQPPVIEWQQVYPGAAEYFTPPYIARASDGTIGLITMKHELVKLSETGNVLWKTTIPAQNAESGLKAQIPSGLAPTRDGGFVVSAVDVVGLYLTKFDSNGSRVWVKKVVDTNSTDVKLIQTNDGGFLVADFRAQQGANRGSFVTKFDQDGNLLWQTEPVYPYNLVPGDVGSTTVSGALSLADGGYLVVGLTRTFNGNSIFASWAAKLDNQGKLIWQNKYNSAARLDGVINNPSGDGSFITAGYSDRSNGTSNVEILTIKADGNLSNATSLGNALSAGNGGFKLSIVSAPNTDGIPSYTIFDTGSQRDGDFRLTNFDTNNQVRWTKYLGGTAGEVALGLVAANNGYYAVGLSNSKDGDLSGQDFQFAGTWLVKLANPPRFTVLAPTYNCNTGAITFNISGGDGSPITYSAPGITRSSASSNTGVVEQGLRNDPKPITIQATQSGYTTSYTFDLISACSNPFKPPVLVKAIPNMRYTVGQALKQEDFYLGNYIVDPTQSQPRYFPEWTASIKGLPAGISQNTFGDLRYNLSVSLAGAPTVSGVYTVTATAATQYFPSQPVTTTFTITVVDESVVNPPTGGTLALTQPTYNCATGAITFNTTGGDGSPITYTAPGITRSSASSSTGVVEQGLRNDPKPITIQATQSGYTTSYTFDLKAFCSPRQRSPIYTSIADRSLEVGKLLLDPFFEIGQGYYSPSDPNNYKKWSFTAMGLPPGLSLETEVVMSTFFIVRIGGKPTTVGTYPVTVTAIDPLYPNDPYATRFTLTVVNPTASGLSLLAPTYDCASGAIRFNTSGGDGSPIEFKSAGITDWTTNPNQFVDKDSRTANDVQPFTLMARQSGQMVSYTWNLKAACGRARMGDGEAGSGLAVKVLGNPVIGQSAEVEVSGVTGQTVQFKLVDLQGKTLHGHTIPEAGSVERVSLPLGSAQGLFLLDVSTATQRQQIKLMRQ